jgi:cytosine/adenosine deaminase-related metal-dependent hydrolase
MTDDQLKTVQTYLYCAHWVLPISSVPILDGAIAIQGDQIVAVGSRPLLIAEYPEAHTRDFGNAAIMPGLINAHSHLELTVMRGFLEREESDFQSWLKKLTVARRERLTPDDLYISAAWGACEAARSGVTCVADASDSGWESMSALRDVGLRGTVFQESFGPDPKFAADNFEKLKSKVLRLQQAETPLVNVGVSPHAVYTVCASQLELVSDFAVAEKLPLMMHAAESTAEEMFVREGRGPFARGLQSRGLVWTAPGVSTIQYLAKHGVLETQPLLAHCINVDRPDIETIVQAGAKVAHCPKSNAKLGHSRAPLVSFLKNGVSVGLGSDSVASNNTCDLLEEGRFAVLFARAGTDLANVGGMLSANEALRLATIEGAQALGLKEQVGTLQPGRHADFAVVSLGGRHQVPSYDPADTLVFSSSGQDVVLTVVAGREVYREGSITTIDESRLRARLGEISERLSS